MSAQDKLMTAFAGRADSVPSDGAPRVGLFGDGLPEALIRAAGARPVEVKAPPLADATSGPVVAAVSAIAEPFLDDFARRFLHRFAAGAFAGYALIVFARDDVAALTAYQYALELQRTGVVGPSPRLHLWNLLHTDTSPARAFNRAELDRLMAALSETLGAAPAPEALAEAVAAEARRAAFVAHHLAGQPQAFALRMAGRWLDPDDHCDLLAGLAASPPRPGLRIGLVGTACDLPVLHDIAGRFGTVAADLTPYGDLWPACHQGPAEAPALIDAVATAPLHIRANPPARFGAALAQGLSGCDLVLCAVDANDDGFGWEIPALRAATEARGARFVNLGFRPFRPGTDWREKAEARIAEALA